MAKVPRHLVDQSVFVVREAWTTVWDAFESARLLLVHPDVRKRVEGDFGRIRLKMRERIENEGPEATGPDYNRAVAFFAQARSCDLTASELVDSDGAVASARSCLRPKLEKAAAALAAYEELLKAQETVEILSKMTQPTYSDYLGNDRWENDLYGDDLADAMAYGCRAITSKK